MEGRTSDGGAIFNKGTWEAILDQDPDLASAGEEDGSAYALLY